MYATTDDLADYIGSTLPANAELLLRRAASDVDSMLIGSVYPVDSAGDPTQADHIEAIKLATCAQAHYLDPLNQEGKLGRFSSFTVGSISATRAARSSTTASGGDRYSSDALGILRVAGLLPGVINAGPTAGDWLARP
jgi:hypothetical protein